MSSDASFSASADDPPNPDADDHSDATHTYGAPQLPTRSAMISAICTAAWALLGLARLSSGAQGQGEVPTIPVTSYVVFSIAVGKPVNGKPRQPVGDIVIGLLDEFVPYTSANFAQIALGGVIEPTPRGNVSRSYTGSQFHRVVPGFVIQGGDITTGDGRGGYSVFGRKFKDENFNVKHYGAGWVSMANSGPDTNNSQFFITLAPTPGLDGKHVVFGKVLKGMKLVHAIAGVPTAKERPTVPIVIWRSTWRKLETPIMVQLAATDPNI